MFDYTAIADRLRTVSWRTDVVNRFTGPTLPVKSKGHERNQTNKKGPNIHQRGNDNSTNRSIHQSVKYKRTDACHCAANNRAPFTDGHSRWTFLQTRGETRYPGGVSVSCLASRTGYQLPARKWPKNQPAENSNGQRSPPKTTITTRLRTDLGRQWTPVLTATKIKERHYNNVLSFPTFTTSDRENTRQRTIDGLQPSPPWTQLRSGTGRTPKERRTRSRQQGNP